MSQRLDWLALLGRRAALAASVLLAIACDDSPDMPPRVSETPLDGQSTPTVAPSAKPCDSGNVRECKVILPEQNGIENCFQGLQLCVAGSWGECVDADTLERQLASLEASGS